MGSESQLYCASPLRLQDTNVHAAIQLQVTAHGSEVATMIAKLGSYSVHSA